MKIYDMQRGDNVDGCYLLRSADVRYDKTGTPYFTGTVADDSGSIGMVMWKYTGDLGPESEGRIVKLSGKIGDFRDTDQLVATKLRLAREDEYDISEIVPSLTREDADGRMSWLEEVLSNIPDEDYRALAAEVFRRHREEFKVIPAAKTMHHSLRSGLLLHTTNMLSMALAVADIYGELIDRSLLIAGVILHDIAKTREFVFSPVGLVNDYTVEGDLLGHLVMGAMEVRDIALELGTPDEKSLLLQHMLLSHHGEPDRGAAVVPQCVEAEILSRLDGMDSRIRIYEEQLDYVEPGRFSPGQIRGLEHGIYKRSKFPY